MSGALLSMDGQKALGFHQKYLCVLKMNEILMGLELPTLSHGNLYVFYEVANSYEFVRPHSYDLVRFV